MDLVLELTYLTEKESKKKTQQQPTTIESHVLEDTAFPTAQINYFTENEVGGLMQKQIDSWFQLKLPDVKWWTSFEPNPVFHCCYLLPQKIEIDLLFNFWIVHAGIIEWFSFKTI